MINQHLSTTPEAEKDLAQTPWWLIRQIQSVTGLGIAHDVCALPETAKARSFWTVNDDSLGIKDWAHGYRRVNAHGSAWAFWMNPPFSDVEAWVKKASEESRKGLIIIGLVKDAPDTDWFQRYVEREATAVYVPDGRVKFLRPDGSEFEHLNKNTGKMVKSGPNFPVCLPVWTPMRLGMPAPRPRFTREPVRFGCNVKAMALPASLSEQEEAACLS